MAHSSYPAQRCSLNKHEPWLSPPICLTGLLTSKVRRLSAHETKANFMAVGQLPLASLQPSHQSTLGFGSSWTTLSILHSGGGRSTNSMPLKSQLPQSLESVTELG